MKLTLPARIAIIAFSFLAVFWMPWHLTLLCIFISGLAFPPAAVALGILSDLLYYPGYGIVWGTVDGLLLALLALGVLHFVKTRIM